MNKTYWKILLVTILLAGMITGFFYTGNHKSAAAGIEQLKKEELPGLFSTPGHIYYGSKYIDSDIAPEDGKCFSGTITFERNSRQYTRPLQIYPAGAANRNIIVIQNDYRNNPRYLLEDADLFCNMLDPAAADTNAVWELQNAQVIAPGILQCQIKQHDREYSIKIEVIEQINDRGVPVISVRQIMDL